MPLPIIPTTSQTRTGVLQSIKDRLFNSKTTNTAANQNDSATPAAPVRSPARFNPQPFNRVSSASLFNLANTGAASIQRNQDATAKAIALSRGSDINPLIPLIQNVNHTLIRN